MISSLPHFLAQRSEIQVNPGLLQNGDDTFIENFFCESYAILLAFDFCGFWYTHQL
jgi:hypothetical protein